MIVGLVFIYLDFIDNVSIILIFISFVNLIFFFFQILVFIISLYIKERVGLSVCVCVCVCVFVVRVAPTSLAPETQNLTSRYILTPICAPQSPNFKFLIKKKLFNFLCWKSWISNFKIINSAVYIVAIMLWIFTF